MKVLATLARPDAGMVRVAGYDRQRQPAAVRACVGVLGHPTLLYQDLTAVENLQFYGRLHGVAHLDERVGQVLEMVGMAPWGDHRVRTLSHGMQKRVSLARAILHDPRVLLLDEPESGLDREALRMLEAIIWQFTVTGRAVLMTTHNLEWGLPVAHRVGVLREGRVVYPEAKEAARALEATGTAP